MKKERNLLLLTFNVLLVCVVLFLIVFIVKGKSGESTEHTVVSAEQEVIEEDLQTAKLLEMVITKELESYCGGTTIVAIADTDRKMQAYKSVNEVLKNASVSNSSENIFEINVKKMLEKYVTAKEATNGEISNEVEIQPKQVQQQFWLRITGTREEGYQVQVECAKTDPFLTSRSDLIETIIARELSVYVSGNNMTAVADTDREMQSYTSVNEILKNSNVNYTKNTFEENVKNMLAEYTSEVDGEIRMKSEDESRKFWIKISGVYESGYQINVLCAKTDPFLNERIGNTDIGVDVYYERKDITYSSDVCILGVWIDTNTNVTYHVFDSEGYVNVSIPDGSKKIGVFVKDVKQSNDVNGELVKAIEDIEADLTGYSGNTLNVHIKESIFVDKPTEISQNWILN